MSKICANLSNMKTLNNLILLALLSVSSVTAQADMDATTTAGATADAAAATMPTDTTSAVTPAAMPATAPASANIFAPAPKPAGDPTQVFFSALIKCSPGNYSEKNILSESVGGDMLNHHIIGMDKAQMCEVTLGTPDGRTMDCSFKPDDLSTLADPHFISGILSDTVDNPSDEAVKADELWNGLKAGSCSF
jgi:hypothetical protein